MQWWPQIGAVLWLTISAASGLWFAARPRRRLIVLNSKQQATAALFLAVAAIGEASLLLAGGFFKGMF